MAAIPQNRPHRLTLYPRNQPSDSHSRAIVVKNVARFFALPMRCANFFPKRYQHRLVI